MRKNNTRTKTYKAKPKRKVKKVCTPKKQQDKVKKVSTPKKQQDDDIVIITIKDYDKYKPVLDEMKRRGITPDNMRERRAELDELFPLWLQCKKGGKE